MKFPALTAAYARQQLDPFTLQVMLDDVLAHKEQLRIDVMRIGDDKLLVHYTRLQAEYHQLQIIENTLRAAMAPQERA